MVRFLVQTSDVTFVRIGDEIFETHVSFLWQSFQCFTTNTVKKIEVWYVD